MSLIEKVKAELKDEFSDNSSIVVADVSQDKPFNHNPLKQYRAASLIKLPVALALFDGIEAGMFSLDETLTLTESDAVYRPQDKNGHIDNSEVGTVFKVSDVLDETMTKSDNTAANMLIRYVGMEQVNNLMQEFGYVMTSISRKMCDKEARALGNENYTTASEMVHMLKDLHLGRILTKEHSKYLIDTMSESKFKSKITKYLPEDVVVPRKGGYLEPFHDHPAIVQDVGLVQVPDSHYVIGVFIEGMDKINGNEFIAQVSNRVYHTVVKE